MCAVGNTAKSSLLFEVAVAAGALCELNCSFSPELHSRGCMCVGGRGSRYLDTITSNFFCSQEGHIYLCCSYQYVWVMWFGLLESSAG